MNQSKVLVLGDGLLGSSLVDQTGWSYVSRKKDGFDITDVSTYHLMTKVEFGVIQHCPYDVIVNTIACTDTYSKDRSQHWSVNYEGVANLVDFCNQWKVKLVHIVTDYIYANSTPGVTEEDVPVHCNNWYGYTKLLGDAHVQLKSDEYVLIRSTHKPEPFTYEKAWVNQVGNFDYISEISKLMIKLIGTGTTGIYNLGTEVKTMYELAKRTKPEVQPDFKLSDSSTPDNLVMDIAKLNKKLKGLK